MTQETPENTGGPERSDSNTVALIGAILLCVALGLCGLLLVFLDHLPDGIEELRQLSITGPAQLRLLILVCATGVLNVVSFLLCVVGLIVPNRPRLLAAIGTIGSIVLLLGFFGVLTVGTLMNPVPAENPSEQSDEEEQAALPAQ